MTTFDKREQAMENKFAHDAELRFKLLARRRKLLGIWAAQHMRMEEEESLDYALQLVRYGASASVTPEDVANKVLEDMQQAGETITLERIQEKMEELLHVAEHQVIKEAE